MSDRPLTLTMIAVAILVALWLRRNRMAGALVSPEQARAEGAKRGVTVTLTRPITREMFERLMHP